MKWDTVKGNWALVRGNSKLQWKTLSGDKSIKMAGRYDHLGAHQQKACDSNNPVMLEELDDFVGPHKEDGRRR